MLDPRVIFFALLVILVLMIVLISLSLSHGEEHRMRGPLYIVHICDWFVLTMFCYVLVEYYEYGLDQRKTTRSVDTETVYARWVQMADYRKRLNASTLQKSELTLSFVDVILNAAVVDTCSESIIISSNIRRVRNDRIRFFHESGMTSSHHPITLSLSPDFQMPTTILWLNCLSSVPVEATNPSD